MFKRDNNNQKKIKVMTKDILNVKNDGSKLCRQLLSLVDSSRGNNYIPTHIEVRVFDTHIVVSTFCVNEYGSAWDNEDYTQVERSNLPFFTLKKLGMV